MIAASANIFYHTGSNSTFWVKIIVKIVDISSTLINFDKIEKIRGFDVIFVTSAKTNEEAKILLQKLGLPFAK